MLSSEAWIAVGVLVIAAVVGMTKRSDEALKWSKESLRAGLENPPLWVYVNEGDVNSRWWSDFGARSTRVLNVPLLNLCYETIAKKNGVRYRVEVIRGVQDLAIRMGGWGALPQPLQNRLAPIGVAELHWIRTAVLKKWGGLWVSPEVICIREFPMFPRGRVVGFGTDREVDAAGPDGTPAPGTRVMWSPEPEHPMFVEWEARCRGRLETLGGGKQVRNDFAVDWLELAPKYKPIVLADAEVDRTGVRKTRLDLEDLLATGTGGDIPFKVGDAAYYVSLPYSELLNRRAYGWILRMSEEQILESDIAIKYLF